MKMPLLSDFYESGETLVHQVRVHLSDELGSRACQAGLLNCRRASSFYTDPAGRGVAQL